jgi:hypothetical protein
MVKLLVREDADGKFVKSMGNRYRPGGVIGYDHAFDMSGENVPAGKIMVVHHMRGHPCIKIRLDDGSIRVWSTEYEIAKSNDQRARMAAAQPASPPVTPAETLGFSSTLLSILRPQRREG